MAKPQPRRVGGLSGSLVAQRYADPLGIGQYLTMTILFSRLQVHYLRLLPAPFLRPFDKAVERSLTVAEDDVNDLSMTEDGSSLACCSDDGKLAVGKLPLYSFQPLR
jgi:hypothetical protein